VIPAGLAMLEKMVRKEDGEGEDDAIVRKEGIRTGVAYSFGLILF
jgi:hypothetical protein